MFSEFTFQRCRARARVLWQLLQPGAGEQISGRRYSPGRRGSAPPGRTRPAQGLNTSPNCLRYACSVRPLRAAYARTPRLPTSPKGVILGITAVTVMSSPARWDSSWAYPAMNRWVALNRRILRRRVIR